MRQKAGSSLFPTQFFSLFFCWNVFFSVASIALLIFRGKKVRGKHALASQVIRKLKVSQGYAALTHARESTKRQLPPHCTAAPAGCYKHIRLYVRTRFLAQAASSLAKPTFCAARFFQVPSSFLTMLESWMRFSRSST